MEFERCKTCKERKTGCHSGCPFYVARKLVMMEFEAKKEEERLKRDQTINGVKRASEVNHRRIWSDI